MKGFDPIFKIYCQRGLFNMSKTGSPVYIDRIGLSQLDNLFKRMNQDDLMDYFTQQQEYMNNIVLPICSKHMGKRVDKIICIYDLKKVNMMTMFDSDFKKLLKIGSKISQDYYPESLQKAIILNASSFFNAIWTVVKKFLHYKTVEKFTVLKTKYQQTLEQMIDKKHIPTFYGGDDNSQLIDDPGPWQKELLQANKDRRLEMKSRKYFFEYYLTPEEKQVWIAKKLYVPSSSKKIE